MPGFGIAPIDVSRDTAGPMEKTVADVAITLQSLAEIPGSDKENNEEFEGMEGPHFLENRDVLPAPFTTVPDYTSALSTEFVKGKRIGYNGATCSPTPCTPTPTQEAVAKAVKALEEAGAIMVPDAQTTAEKTRSLPSGYEAHATIDEYYAHLGVESAREKPRPGDRSRRHQPAGGAEGRQLHARQRGGSRRHARRQKPERIRRNPA